LSILKKRLSKSHLKERMEINNNASKKYKKTKKKIPLNMDEILKMMFKVFTANMKATLK